MFALISGAPGSGKSTVVSHLKGRLPRVRCHDEDELNHLPGSRQEKLESWVQEAIRAEERGEDLLLVAQSPLGGLLSCPSADRLESIAACLLDCHDLERARRIRARAGGGDDPAWMTHDVFCWASWHRMHAADPAWTQNTIEPDAPRRGWARWSGWGAGDPRWEVEVIDTTHTPVEEIVEAVVAWFARSRSRSPLSRAARWWLSGD